MVKSTHFRKAGISIPDGAAFHNLENFKNLLKRYSPREVYFLGDLFHSEMNSEWLAFKKLLEQNQDIRFHLVQGNHDIFHEDTYNNKLFQLHQQPLKLRPFILSHEPLEGHTLYNICGHIHPGVRMHGKARQSLRFPCFYFTKNQAILPAFGKFTGLYTLKPSKHDEVFILVNSSVIKAV